MLQVVSAAKWRVSGFLFLEPVRDQLACKHDLQSRHGVALAEGYRMTRGEIDYVASNRSIDPRDIRSAGPPNGSNVDDQIGLFPTHQYPEPDFRYGSCVTKRSRFKRLRAYRR